MTSRLVVLATTLLVLATSAGGVLVDVVTFDAVPYAGRGDSPFELDGGGFFLEDFEDGALDTPGVRAIEGHVRPPSPQTESVDDDDGARDGSGTRGHSFYSDAGSVQLVFDASVLGGYPTAVGLVSTGGEAPLVLRWLNADGDDLIGGTRFNDSPGSCGRTDDDRFLGVVDPRGIVMVSLFRLSDQRPGPGLVEIDHLQYSAVALAPVEVSPTTTTTLPPASCDLAPAAVQTRIDAACPCGRFARRGDYRRCARRAVREAIRRRTLPRACRDAARACASRSTCGNAQAVACCMTDATGEGCRVEKTATSCTASGGSVGPGSSCCTACAATACAAAGGAAAERFSPRPR